MEEKRKRSDFLIFLAFVVTAGLGLFLLRTALWREQGSFGTAFEGEISGPMKADPAAAGAEKVVRAARSGDGMPLAGVAFKLLNPVGLFRRFFAAPVTRRTEPQVFVEFRDGVTEDEAVEDLFKQGARYKSAGEADFAAVGAATGKAFIVTARDSSLKRWIKYFRQDARVKRAVPLQGGERGV